MSLPPTPVYSILSSSVNDVIALDMMPHEAMCSRCNYNGADVRFVVCGCCIHSRCLNLCNPPIMHCPFCPGATPTGLALLPMSFDEIDRARASAASLSTSKKRKKMKDTVPSFEDGETDCRTGRWTPEEISFCDQLIKYFQLGDLPLLDGVKLNDFLATMLKSKQSRLTKKMKNANFSGKIFQRTHGFISNLEEAKAFSEIEEAFLRSVADPVEQAQIRFYMQKEWREMISSYCTTISQPLDADAWLSSVEEMEKRESSAKDAARMTRRKMMMGIALDQDIQNPDQGVFIEKSSPFLTGFYDNFLDNDDLLNLFNDKPTSTKSNDPKAGQRHYWHYSSPFLGKVIAYIQRHNCPFEHVDIWVPSFVPDSDASEGSGSNVSSCRLCFAGSATADLKVPPNGIGPLEMIDSDEQFNLLSFGDYSQKFSFNVGCGLPGRVYESGIPAWEQSVHNAPLTHFERNGGANQWGIRTVVGIPIPSPNVGRIVVVLYSRYDRPKDPDLVSRLYEELKKLIPSPKWKLIVDIGKASNSPTDDFTKPSLTNVNMEVEENNIVQHVPSQSNIVTSTKAPVASNGISAVNSNSIGGSKRIQDLVALLGNYMPNDASMQNFMSLRLMLLKPSRTQIEKEIEETLLSSYDSYISSGRGNADIAVMIVRDYVFLQQLHQPKPLTPIGPQYTHASAPAQSQGMRQNPQIFQHQPQDNIPNGAMNQPSTGYNQAQQFSAIPDVSNHSYNLHLGSSSEGQSKQSQ